MIRDHNREYLNFIGFCDIRPSQQQRAVKEFSDHKQYGPAEAKKLKKYADVKDEMLADKDVEVVVIALPLWLHAPIAIEAMKAGKHVFCEKLMAHSVRRVQGDVPGRPRDEPAARHRPPAPLLGALRQRQLPGPERPPRRHPPHPRPLAPQQRPARRSPRTRTASRCSTRPRASPVYVQDEKGNIVYIDSWKPPIPELDKNVDFAKYGYKSLDELVRWRLYNRTGAGLMAELGSHQLDACSIFLGKKHPLAVTGIGGTYFYTDGREVDDHVFVTFEFPGKSRRTRATTSS